MNIDITYYRLYKIIAENRGYCNALSKIVLHKLLNGNIRKIAKYGLTFFLSFGNITLLEFLQ